MKHNNIFSEFESPTINVAAITNYIKSNSDKINEIDEAGWTLLHHLAKAEAEQKISIENIEILTNFLLEFGANIHQDAHPKPGYQIRDTPFNIAAPASPIIGRLMTNHWLKLALENQGPKALNDRSGSHNSTLAQYMAKWSNADEIEAQLNAALAKKMNIAVQNASGWTPLHAACAMGRIHAVRAFSNHYTKKQLELLTTEEYSTQYAGFIETIIYLKGLTALDIAKARLEQSKTLSANLHKDLQECVNDLASKTFPKSQLQELSYTPFLSTSRSIPNLP
jgi:ankyrin repeat protein